MNDFLLGIYSIIFANENEFPYLIAFRHVQTVDEHVECLQFRSGFAGDIKKTFYEVGVQTILHYLPNYLFSIYRKCGYQPGLCPVAEKVFFEEP